ncbi:MAG: YecA family protein, partial [Pseudomonadota bacterium]|nr:YecA family protein [Pseudomonadota bacterium]
MAALNLDILFDYLDGEQNEFGLDFAATHGFLCATVVGPELRDWLSHLFDAQHQKVPAEILDQIQLWRTDIQQTLANEETIELPFEVEEADVESSLGDWSIGFIDALFLNEDHDWYDIDEEAVGMLTLPMMGCSGIDVVGAQLRSGRRTGDVGA